MTCFHSTQAPIGRNAWTPVSPAVARFSRGSSILLLWRATGKICITQTGRCTSAVAMGAAWGLLGPAPPPTVSGRPGPSHLASWLDFWASRNVPSRDVSSPSSFWLWGAKRGAWRRREDKALVYRRCHLSSRCSWQCGFKSLNLDFLSMPALSPGAGPGSHGQCAPCPLHVPLSL